MMRIEIIARDEFWRNAVITEWEDQHPQRTLIKEADGSFLIESEWLDDIKGIAADCLSTIVVAPMDPSRRSWFRQFIPGS
jgi:hypothetical protein